MDADSLLVFWLVTAIVSAGATQPLAEKKHLNGKEYFFLGLLFGPFAVAGVLAAPYAMPKAPSGMFRSICPRCMTEQHTLHTAEQFECWRCGITTPLARPHLAQTD